MSDSISPDEIVKQLHEAFGEPEDLDPELEAHRFETETLSGIHHPLYISPFHNDIMNAMANKALRSKREAIARYSAQGKWQQVIWLHERPYRIEALSHVAQYVDDDEEYWELVRAFWIDSENIWESRDDWISLLTAPRAGRELMMEPSEREALEAMDDPIRVFRGFSFDGAENGMSWTIDVERADWFGRRFADVRGDSPRRSEGLVPKDQVIGYFTCRGEEEIVVLPDTVTIDNIVDLD